MTTELRELRRPTRVLLILDRPVLAAVITLALTHGRYATQVAQTVDAAIGALGGWAPHLAVVDMDLVGDTMLERLKGTLSHVERLPVIALTRRGDLATTLAAFEWGVDDVLVEPFAPEELVARMLAVMRRAYGEAVAFTPVLRLGALAIDILHRRVTAGGRELHLTALEQSLLYLPGGERRAIADPRRDPRLPVGHGPRGGEQRGRPPRPQSAHQAGGRLA